MNATSAKMQIPPDRVGEVRSWFRTRGGCVRWRNVEIGVIRPDIMTPATNDDGTPSRPPHWAYIGRGEPIAPDDIEVLDRQYIPLPLDWFPVCEHCSGSGRRPIADLAAVRGQTVPHVLELMAPGGCLDHVQGYRPSDGTINCAWCQGTGHVERHVHVAIRRHYWGVDISETGKRRAAKLARKLGPDVEWDWRNEGYGLASLVFYRDTVSPFTMGD